MMASEKRIVPLSRVAMVMEVSRSEDARVMYTNVNDTVHDARAAFAPRIRVCPQIIAGAFRTKSVIGGETLQGGRERAKVHWLFFPFPKP
jgi:hypothetical protein